MFLAALTIFPSDQLWLAYICLVLIIYKELMA